MNPSSYRKRPVIVQAWQFREDNIDQIRQWITDHGGTSTIDAGVFRIETLEGPMAANPGDWVIQGVKGEFYPCKPDIFAATYDEA